MSKFNMDFSKLLSQIDSATTKKSYSNENAGEYWKPTKDKSGNAAAVIRFLPNKDIEDFPFVRMYAHNFKDAETGRWYIENSLTTIGGQDLVSTVNKELWNTGIEENKKLASLRKRKLQYISNILVIKDLGAPENNGKVFKYKYGAKIWEKISGAAKGNEELGETPVMAFDPITGADFLLKMQKANDQYNYDASKFNTPKAMCNGDDDEIEAVLVQCYDLNLEVSADKFKTEKELESKFLWVTGQVNNSNSNSNSSKPVNAAKQAQFDADDAEMGELSKLSEEAEKAAAAKAKPKAEPAKPTRKSPPPLPDSDDGDDAAFFNSLLE